MKIKETVDLFVKKHGTRNPFELIDSLDILLQRCNLGQKAGGYYMEYEGIQCICINDQIKDKNLANIIAAHELGHAIMHRGTECMFYNGSLYNIKKTETQANIFSAELLVPDSVIKENEGYTKEQIAKKLGYVTRLLDFKKI